MKSVKKVKLKRHGLHTPKTREDFQRWLQKRKTLERHAEAELNSRTARELGWPLMVWVDDGGSVT